MSENVRRTCLSVIHLHSPVAQDVSGSLRVCLPVESNDVRRTLIHHPKLPCSAVHVEDKRNLWMVGLYCLNDFFHVWQTELLELVRREMMRPGIKQLYNLSTLAEYTKCFS